MKKRTLWAIGISLLLLASDGVGPLGPSSNAFAVVGRPFTPLSYAGVARRTTRRAVYRTAAVTTSAAYVSTLPSGCVEVYGASYYNCGSVRYNAVYQGGSLVYVRQ